MDAVARNIKQKFNKISSWTKENVKTFEVCHGYNVDNGKIWKDIINRMKHCVQVWQKQKTRARLECGRSWVRTPVGSKQRL
jgi:endo-1,4-beta-D-glucanase Y